MALLENRDTAFQNLYLLEVHCPQGPEYQIQRLVTELNSLHATRALPKIVIFSRNYLHFDTVIGFV